MSEASRRYGLACAVAFALVMAASPSSLHADHAWGCYHWSRPSNPVTLTVGDNVNATWDPYLDEAISDWNQSNALQLNEVAGAAKGKNCRPNAGRIEACNARYGNTGWLGIAQIWVSGCHITQASTRVNDTYFDTPQYNTPAWRRLVMCQEIAHDFGLDHQDEAFDNPNLGSCMDYTSDPDGPPSNEHPNNHDYDQIATIYGHLDANIALPSQPPAMSQIDYDTPRHWGQKVRSLGNGRVEEYVLDFGGGHKLLTRVIWAAGPRANRDDGR